MEHLIYEFYYLVKVIFQTWKWLQISSSSQFLYMLNFKYLLYKQVCLCFLLNFALEELLAMTTVAGAQYYVFH